MARRVSLQLAVALILVASGLSAQGARETGTGEVREARTTREAEPTILVGYSFEESDLSTGPDTFRVFESSQGSVALSPQFRTSGYYSVELRDQRGDGEFPELQGYFPERRTGRLYAHFALLLTSLDEELNVALAGPRWFRLAKDGISFWLSLYDRTLVHYSDSMPKRLFAPELFVWYEVDVALDIDAGRYDLRIVEEGAQEPIVDLRSQPNAASQPKSAVDKYSFIGDRGQDTSAVTYYVDDVVLATDQPVQLLPFVAPGRRHLFIDSLGRFKEHGGGRPVCLPVMAPSDFGVDSQLLAALRRAGALHLLSSLGSPLAASAAAETTAPGGAPEPAERVAVHVEAPPGVEIAGPALPEGWLPIAQAAAAWRRGCSALLRGESADALAQFDHALELAPEARIYQASFVLALAQGGHWDLLDEWMSWLGGEWQDDPRYPVLAARVGSARGDLGEAESWVGRAAEALLSSSPSPLVAKAWTGHRSRQLTAALEEHFPGDWPHHVEQALVAEQYYYVLLWQERSADAHDYALELAAILEQAGLSQAVWLERAADAAFYDGRPAEALELYRRAQQLPEAHTPSLLLKLADVHYALGDLESERRLRETIYGRLD